MNTEMWKKGEKHGYEAFLILLQSFAHNTANCMYHFGEAEADEYVLGFFYTLEDEMANLEQTIRG